MTNNLFDKGKQMKLKSEPPKKTLIASQNLRQKKDDYAAIQTQEKLAQESIVKAEQKVSGFKTKVDDLNSELQNVESSILSAQQNVRTAEQVLKTAQLNNNLSNGQVQAAIENLRKAENIRKGFDDASKMAMDAHTQASKAKIKAYEEGVQKVDKLRAIADKSTSLDAQTNFFWATNELKKINQNDLIDSLADTFREANQNLENASTEVERLQAELNTLKLECSASSNEVVEAQQELNTMQQKLSSILSKKSELKDGISKEQTLQNEANNELRKAIDHKSDAFQTVLTKKTEVEQAMVNYQKAQIEDQIESLKNQILTTTWKLGGKGDTIHFDVINQEGKSETKSMQVPHRVKLIFDLIQQSEKTPEKSLDALKTTCRDIKIKAKEAFEQGGWFQKESTKIFYGQLKDMKEFWAEQVIEEPKNEADPSGFKFES